MLKRRTGAVLTMLRIILFLLIVASVLSVPILLITQSANQKEYNPFDPEDQEEMENIAIVLCFGLCIIGLMGLGVFGLMIASGIVMILSRVEYEKQRTTALISGIFLLVSAALPVFVFFPFINLVFVLIFYLTFFGSFIIYIHSLTSRSGRIISYVAGGLIGFTLIIVDTNLFLSTFVYSGDLPVWLVGISVTGLLLQVVSYILLLVSVSKTREELEGSGSSIKGFENYYDNSDRREGIPGKTQPASEDWLSYATADDASNGDR
ncbi:MAG: hypothetical protein ACMUIE_04460 [Thermoplasmatota archaeon]